MSKPVWHIGLWGFFIPVVIVFNIMQLPPEVGLQQHPPVNLNSQDLGVYAHKTLPCIAAISPDFHYKSQLL